MTAAMIAMRSQRSWRLGGLIIGSGSFMLVAVCEFCEEYCGLHEAPSDGAAGDYLGEECDCFHVGWLGVNILYVVLRDCRRGVVANGEDSYSM
jgi:hypothetical protein